VRDAVIDYITAKGIFSPAIEGRLAFIADTEPPVMTVNKPAAGQLYNPQTFPQLDVMAVDTVAGVGSIAATINGPPVWSGQPIDPALLVQGNNTLSVIATDKAGNVSAEATVTFVYDSVAPVITLKAPTAIAFLHPDYLTLDFAAADATSGVALVEANLDGPAVVTGQKIDLYTLALGDHTLTVKATDVAGNQATVSVKFSVTATVQSLKASINRFYQEGKITKAAVRTALLKTLDGVQSDLNKGRTKQAALKLAGFLLEVNTFGAHSQYIKADAKVLLQTDARWVFEHLKQHEGHS
jgi:hypothetical protein